MISVGYTDCLPRIVLAIAWLSGVVYHGRRKGIDFPITEINLAGFR